MTKAKTELSFTKLEKALLSLKYMAFKPMQDDRGNIDSTIQRFEFTIELFWKLLKHILETKGTRVQYPKDVLQEAYKGELINDELEWLKMLSDRNLTSHTYDEELAETIYLRIKTYVPILSSTFAELKKKYGITQ